MKALIALMTCCVSLSAQVNTLSVKSPIAIDRVQPNGDAFVLSSAGCVYRVHDDGKRLSSVGSFVLPLKEYPSDIVAAIVSGQQAVFISGLRERTGYVSWYSEVGQLKRTWIGPYALSGLDYDFSHGTIYTVSSDGNHVLTGRVSNSSNLLQLIGDVDGARQLGPVIFDSVGNRLLIGEIANGDIYAFDIMSRHSRLLFHGFGSPQALMLSEDSRTLYVADSARRAVYKLDLTKPSIAPVAFSHFPMFREPVGLTRLPNGRIAVADDRANTVFVLTALGTVQAN